MVLVEKSATPATAFMVVVPASAMSALDSEITISAVEPVTTFP